MGQVRVFELMHGIVLTKVLRAGGVALRLVETDTHNAWAAYTINDAVITYVKYALSPRQTRREEKLVWRFTFQPAELEKIEQLREQKPVYTTLVCGLPEVESQEMQVCHLDADQIDTCIDLKAKKPQTLTVECRSGSSLRAYGAKNTAERDKLVISRNKLDNWKVPGS